MKPARRVLITGVSRGLGRAMVDEFTRLGHAVCGCSRSPQAIAELNDQFAAPHQFAVVDVTQTDQVDAWVKRILSAGEPPDLVINNAALINENRPLWEVSHDEFQSVLNVNVAGVFHVIRAIAPAMIARNSGVIVNFSSGWGRSTSPEVAPYCATKWAVEGLTRALAQELPPGMAAVPLNPGIIDTPMLRSCFGAEAEHYPSAADWARTAVPFLLQLGPRDNGRPLSAP